MEDEEYKKLPADEKCVHKLWKARVNGYEEVTKLFRQIDDEKSPEYGKYLGLVKKFVVDSNAVGQEKGLEATLAYVENYAHAGKTVSEVMSGIVAKCIAAPKAKTRELAVQVTLMYIEIEKGELVQEELIKGMEQKNPKIVAACINACTVALREFGIKIVNPKALIKKIGVLFADRDKTVRDEARSMVVELYKWMGPGLKPHLQTANLQAVQLTELDVEFGKVEGQRSTPLRYIRSQQQKEAKLAAEAANGGDGDGDEAGDDDDDATTQEIDPYELADPVDVLSKLPKDFYEKLEAKKWQERKEALETLENLLKAPKLENGDYGDLVRALKKVVQKDSNVVVVAIAARCISSLAGGLKKRFQTYSGVLVAPLLEKFKEKKQNVVTAVRDAIDAVYLTTNLEAILEDVLEVLGNKNPSVKSETALWLARAFCKTPPAAVNKKLLKAITGALTKNINESDPTVRECSAEAIGTLMKLVGEKAIGPFLVELEKDNLKITKIKECCDKAVITVKVSGSKTVAPQKSATVKKPAETKPAATKPAAKKPAGSAPAKKKTEISSGSATVVRSKGGQSKAPPKLTEKQLDDEEVDEIISGILKANTIMELSSPNWKARLASTEQIMEELKCLDGKSIPTQAIIKTLNKKPGLKDTNFQVLKAKLDVVKYLAENCTFSNTSANCCVCEISEKFGDPKNGAAVCETLTAIAEATSFAHVSASVIDFALGQKSPKVQQEALVWLAATMKEFGFANLNAKLLIESIKKALASNNPGVRQAAIALLGTMYLYMGAALHMFFENEKPALRDQISAEFDKYEGEKPPAPTRGVIKSSSVSSVNTVDEDTSDQPPEPINIQDILPRVDISGQITETILQELQDKNWKVRNEALTKINGILQEAKFIKPNLGDLPQALAGRLTDSNVKIAQLALSICDNVAKAMGPPCKQYVRVLFPGVLQGLGDSKSWMRTAALDTINSFAQQCGYKEFFDGEMISDALKSGSPILRTELWGWLAENLPKVPLKSIPKEELVLCVPHLYNNLEDRNADVRKNAQEAILGIMIHLGYESMVKQTEKLKPGSRSVIMTSLEKVRPNLPTQPLPKKSPQQEKEDKAVRGTKPVAKSAAKPTKGAAAGSATKSAPTSSRKKDEDVDVSPLLVVNNLKHQRTIDESKLKVLKWNFTQPREEFVDLLKDQMATANVNKTLTANMFHADFRYHIKAIDSLFDDLAGNGAALIANLDLILKWLTLRFFDTNPSVLLKGLEYLHSVFNMLIENKYHMLENEAASFVPYLVLKIGDPKDSVRNGVRSLLKQISSVFPVSRLSVYVMEGVKSKNARQRAECLEVMGTMIEDFGITVMPSPAACLKEVAKQISDRDNSVRSAALNCVVQAYNIVGEKVYKMVGNISDKDMSLLEERIKRSSRKSVVIPKTMNSTVVVADIVVEQPQKENASPNRHVNVSDNRIEVGADADDVDEEETLPPVTLPSQLVQEPVKCEVKGPFKLDPTFINELQKSKPDFWKKELVGIDLDFLKEDIKIPSLSDAKAKIIPLSPPKPVTLNSGGRKSFGGSPNTDQSKKQDPLIERAIKQMATTNFTIAIQGAAQIHEILNSNRCDSMVEYEEDFVNALIAQFRYLHDHDPATDAIVTKIYRALLTSIDMFYRKPTLGRKVPVNLIKEFMNELITLLVEGKLEKCGEAYVKVINVNCLKIIENSDHTSIICALVMLINECIAEDRSARHVELVMKCLWKVIKLMPVWADDIDYDSLLLEVHNFLKKFPTPSWSTRQIDTPLRTIKTILHSSVKIKGGSIMFHLGKIPNTSESEVESYILRLLKSLKIAEAQQIPLQSQRKSLTKANHNMLTDIFQKIGNKDETKDGLNLLYDFMQQHSEADIEPFLKKSSKFFQDYIKNGLKEIEESRKKSKQSSPPAVRNSNETNKTISSATVSGKSTDYWKERLNMWNKMYEDIDSSKKVEVPVPNSPVAD